jgi:Fe-S oxidoreductase
MRSMLAPGDTTRPIRDAAFLPRRLPNIFLTTECNGMGIPEERRVQMWDFSHQVEQEGNQGEADAEVHLSRLAQSQDPRLIHHRQCLQCGACTPHCPAALDATPGAFSPRKVMAIFQANGYSLKDKLNLLRQIDSCVQCYTCERTCSRGISTGAINNILLERNEVLGNMLVRTGMLPGAAFLPFYLESPQRMGNFATKELFHARRIHPEARDEVRTLLGTRTPLPLAPIQKKKEKQQWENIEAVFNINSCCSFNFPGVSYAAQYIFDALGIGLVSSKQQSCCGGAPYYLGGLDLGQRILMGARNFCVAAEECTTPTIHLTSVCPTCYDISRENLCYLGHRENVKEVNKQLSRIGRTFDPASSHFVVTHMSDIIYRHSNEMQGQLYGGLAGLRVKVHGSCHKKKWDGVEGTVDPLKHLLCATGAHVVSSSLEVDCCGGIKDLFAKYTKNIRNNPPILTRAHRDEMHRVSIDAIVTDCPGCMLTMDQYGIPVLHITEALGLAMGGNPKSLIRIQDHRTSLHPLLEKVTVL